MAGPRHRSHRRPTPLAIDPWSQALQPTANEPDINMTPSAGPTTTVIALCPVPAPPAPGRGVSPAPDPHHQHRAIPRTIQHPPRDNRGPAQAKQHS